MELSTLLKQLAMELGRFDYVVQRNWENLPDTYEVDGHGDLDLFVSDLDRNEVDIVVRPYQQYFPIDVRSPRDNYYPDRINMLLLEARRQYNGFYIPNEIAFFWALYWHNMAHKDGDPYRKKLNQVFTMINRPVQCIDKGVKYNDFNWTDK